MLPAPALFAAGAERLFDDTGRLADRATRAQLGAVLDAFAAWIELVAPASREAGRGAGAAPAPPPPAL